MQKNKAKIFIYLLLLLSILTLESIDFLHNHNDSTENNCPICILSTNLSATDETVKVNFNSFINCESFILPKDISIHFINLNSVPTDRAPPSVS